MIFINLQQEKMKPKTKGKKVTKKPLPIEVDEKEFISILDNTRQMHHKVAFLLGWGSGLRISEVTNLKKEDFSFDSNPKQIRINMGKNSKDRIVPIPKGFKQKHLNYIPMKCGVRALQKAFISASEKAGVKKTKPKVHFHSLRHGFATQCIRKGMELSYVQGLLGHEDLQTTSIYINLAPKERLNEYYDKF